jgi:hypothetical protein
MDSPEQRTTRAQNIRTVWEALLAPNWTKDDLIDLGKAIFARTPLKRFDQAKFDRILPHLSKLAEMLEAKITPLPADPPGDAPEAPAGPPVLDGPGPCTTGPAGPAASPDSSSRDKLSGPTGPAANPDSRPHHREK